MRRILIPTVFLVAVLSLAGCSSSGGSTADSGTAVGGTSLSQDAPAPAPGSKAASDLVKREVVTTVAVTIKAKNPVSAGDRAAHIAEAAGGRVDARTQTAATERHTATASLTLRVPATKVTATLDELKALGTESSIKMASDDVTTQGQDLDARIKALSTSVDRLLALEARSKNTTDLISLETAISDRQGQLDSLTSQRRYLSDQVAMSTISLRVIAPTALVARGTPSPGDAVAAGFSGFWAFFTGVFLVVSYLLPWILLAGALAAAWILVVRWRHRRHATAL
jgi:Domain of unknown function (DUF4349)